MRLESLLKNRANEKNVIYDFSKLDREELAAFVSAGIDGEKSLSDAEMQLLESGTAKIKTRPGTPRKVKPLPFAWDGRPETAGEFVRKCAITSSL